MAGALDCHAVSSDTNNVSTKSVTVTTVGTDVILYLISHQSDNSNNRTFSTPTDTAGLTWTQRLTSHNQGVSGATSWNNIEIWWALKSVAGSTTITQVVSGSSDHLVLEVMGFTGLNTASPFDPHAGLPFVGFNGTSSNANPTISGGVSTSNNNNVLVGVYSANENFALSTFASRLEPGVGGSPGGFTAVDDFSPGSGSLWERLNDCYKVIAAPISAQAFTISNNSNHTLFIVDALTSDSSGDDAVIDQTLPVLTQEIDCTVIQSAGIDQTLPVLTQEMDVFESSNWGTISQVLPVLTQSLTDEEIEPAIIDMVLPVLKQVLNVNVPNAAGTGAFTAYWTAGP